MEIPAFELRVACEADAEEIASLVNRAYRPSLQDQGWTHEANLIAGERISAEQVLSLFQARSVILLACLGPEIAACVHVQASPSGAHIGLLATHPALQAQGLGKKMLLAAETYAVERLGASLFKMSVLTSRPALLAFYDRRVYVLTEKTEDYPLSANVGQPMVADIRVLFLEKRPAPSRLPH